LCDFGFWVVFVFEEVGLMGEDLEDLGLRMEENEW
jgi:hypothetical protein